MPALTRLLGGTAVLSLRPLTGRYAEGRAPGQISQYHAGRLALLPVRGSHTTPKSVFITSTETARQKASRGTQKALLYGFQGTLNVPQLTGSWEAPWPLSRGTSLPGVESLPTLMGHRCASTRNWSNHRPLGTEANGSVALGLIHCASSWSELLSLAEKPSCITILGSAEIDVVTWRRSSSVRSASYGR